MREFRKLVEETSLGPFHNILVPEPADLNKQKMMGDGLSAEDEPFDLSWRNHFCVEPTVGVWSTPRGTPRGRGVVLGRSPRLQSGYIRTRKRSPANDWLGWVAGAIVRRRIPSNDSNLGEY